MLRILIASVVLAFNLLGAANADEMRMGLFSVTLPVIAILHDELFVGEAVGRIDRTGTIGLRSVLDPKKKCVGSFRYTGLKTGLADMRCDEGVEASLSFNALSAFSGYGYGEHTPRAGKLYFWAKPRRSDSASDNSSGQEAC